jgi:hypothetical protein
MVLALREMLVQRAVFRVQADVPNQVRVNLPVDDVGDLCPRESRGNCDRGVERVRTLVQHQSDHDRPRVQAAWR